MVLILPPEINVFAYQQLASCFSLEVDLENLHRSEVSDAAKAMLKVRNAVNDMLLGKISRSDFLEIVDSCEMLGIDDYLDQVEENLEALGLI